MQTRVQDAKEMYTYIFIPVQENCNFCKLLGSLVQDICIFLHGFGQPCARDLQFLQGFGAALCKRIAIFARCWAVCKEMPLQCVRYPRTSVALPHKLCTTYENQPLKCARYARTLTNKAALCQKFVNFARFWKSPVQEIYNLCKVLEQPSAR